MIATSKQSKEQFQDNIQLTLENSQPPKIISVKSESSDFLCRICLVEGNIPIFNDDSKESQLSENIFAVGKVKINVYDIYPKYLCDSCFSDLHTAIKFRQTAQETDIWLRHPSNYFNQDKEENDNELVTLTCQKSEIQEIEIRGESTLVIEVEEHLLSPQSDGQVIEIEEIEDNTACGEKSLVKEVKDVLLSPQSEQVNDNSEIDPLELVKPKVLQTYARSAYPKNHTSQKTVNINTDCKCKKCDVEFDTKQDLTFHEQDSLSCSNDNDLLVPVKPVFTNVLKSYERSAKQLNSINVSSTLKSQKCAAEIDRRQDPIVHNKQEHVQSSIEKAKKNNLTNTKQNKHNLTESGLRHENNNKLSPIVLRQCPINKYFIPTSNENLVKCLICSRIVSKNYCERHYVGHNFSSTLEYQCMVCHEIFQQRNAFHHHKKTSHCVTMLKNDKGISKINSSGSNVHSDKLYICKECPKKFRNKCVYLNHKLNHKNNQDSSLSCDKYFRDMGNVNKKDTVQCLICYKSLWKLSRRLHLEMAHKEVAYQFLCEICGRGFQRQSFYEHHKSIHDNKFPFQCKLCPFRGQHSNILQTHMLTHSEAKHHICNICGMLYDSLNKLSVHKQIHKPMYKCSACNKIFIKKQSCKKHIDNRHEGENNVCVKIEVEPK